MAVPTIASGALRKLLTAASTLGVDRDAVLTQADIPVAVVDDPEGRIPIVKLHAAWEVILAQRPEAKSVFAGAEAYVPADYGVVGFVLMNSATLGEGLEHFVRYSGLWTDEPVFSHDGPTLRFAYRSQFRDGPGKRAATEMAPVEILHGARLLTQKPIVPDEVRFQHRGPGDSPALEEFCGCKVRFGARDNAVVFAASDLAVPLAKADAQLGAFLRGLANEALAKRSASSESPLDRVREMVAEELLRGLPTVGIVARRMATSERTLRRRLEENGTSFRELLDDTRARLARNYVRDRRIPLSQVAFMLGFSQPSAFHRAFKRWTQTTPADWRARG